MGTKVIKEYAVFNKKCPCFDHRLRKKVKILLPVTVNLVSVCLSIGGTFTI
jgi:hypothetical protein